MLFKKRTIWGAVFGRSEFLPALYVCEGSCLLPVYSNNRPSGRVWWGSSLAIDIWFVGLG